MVSLLSRPLQITNKQKNKKGTQVFDKPCNPLAAHAEVLPCAQGMQDEIATLTSAWLTQMQSALPPLFERPGNRTGTPNHSKFYLLCPFSFIIFHPNLFQSPTSRVAHKPPTRTDTGYPPRRAGGRSCREDGRGAGQALHDLRRGPVGASYQCWPPKQ